MEQSHHWSYSFRRASEANVKEMDEIELHQVTISLQNAGTKYIVPEKFCTLPGAFITWM